MLRSAMRMMRKDKIRNEYIRGTVLFISFEKQLVQSTVANLSLFYKLHNVCTTSFKIVL